MFGIELETCWQCGGKVKVIASIEDPAVIGQILGHLASRERPGGSRRRRGGHPRARFMLLSPSQGNDVRVADPISVDQDNDFRLEQSKGDQPDLAVLPANIFAGNCRVVPDRLGIPEVQVVNAAAMP